MKRIILTVATLVLFAFPVHAKTDTVQRQMHMLENGTMLVKIKKAMRCNKPDTMIYRVPGAPADIGTYCDKTGTVSIYSAGVNYKIIKRLKTQFDTKWWRRMLAKPYFLRRVKESELAQQAIAKIIRFATRGDYAQDNIYCDTLSAEAGLCKKLGELDRNAKNWLRGFITRRAAEAKPEDRQEIVDLWGEIIQHQVELHKVKATVKFAMPAFLR